MRFYAPRNQATVHARVWGKAMRDGQPLVTGQVTLLPTDPSKTVASGLIAKDGTYVLYSGAAGIPGVEPGTYTVLLSTDGAMASREPYGVAHVPPPTEASSIEITPGPQRIDLEFP